MSPETYAMLHAALMFCLGWTCHIGWRMLVSWHDQKRDFQIERLTQENVSLRARLESSGVSADPDEAPLPLMDTEPAESATPEIRPTPVRRRRCPVNGKITPIQRPKIDTAKVSRDISQAEIGRMQAQLSAFGKCRAVLSGQAAAGRR